MVASEPEIDPCQAARIIQWLGGERAGKILFGSVN